MGHVKLTRDERQALQHTRSVHRLAQQESEETYVQKRMKAKKTFVEDLHTELKNVYRHEDKEVVEYTRMLTDWKNLALKVTKIEALQLSMLLRTKVC